jgi:GTPase SAR1 family protein
MSMINYASREINCKIVYYGTGLGGKTTNLEYIYSRVYPIRRGR